MNTPPACSIIVLVTVNENETHALLDAFVGEGKSPAQVPKGGLTYNDLGIHGGCQLIHSVCEMGAGGTGASQQRTRDAIDHWQPKAVIAVGIAFGLDESKQAIGDVLISTQIQDYELGRLNENGTLIPRGDKPSSTDNLRNRFRQTDTNKSRSAENWPKVRFGLILSGQKLVDNLDYRESLKAIFTEAIGGEMEGVGLYVSASVAKVDWIVVKAICDWGHNKNQAEKDAWQKLAAKNAARVLKAALDVGDLYSADVATAQPIATTTAPTNSAALVANVVPSVSIHSLATGLQPANTGPLSRGHYGLDAILKELAGKLEKSRLLALYGMAGIGKSSIIDELYHLHSWHHWRRLPIKAQDAGGINDLFSQLAPCLGIHDERPSAPHGASSKAVAQALLQLSTAPEPLFIHVERAHNWFVGGRWRNVEIAHLIEGIVCAYPMCVVVLESRDEIQETAFHCIEAKGLPEQAISDYFANPPGLVGKGWQLNRDRRRYISSRLGGGHGRGVHAYGLYLLAQLAAGKDVAPDEILRQHSDEYAETLYKKLFHDFYEHVLSALERSLLFACSLYRNGLHYTHLDMLEHAVTAPHAGEALIRRRLLTEDAEWFYLHDLAAEQARYLTIAGLDIPDLHHCIAERWLADLKGQRLVVEANIRRALEALYHLEQAGEGERVTVIALKMLGNRPDEAKAALWRMSLAFHKAHASEKNYTVLEYLHKLDPDDHMACRFLGEARRKRYGSKDKEALSLFKRASELDPNFPQYWADYGNAAIACGLDAVREFLAALKKAPTRIFDDHLNAIRASALQADGQGEEASRLRREKIDAGSGDAAFYCDEAKWLLEEKKDPKAALAILERALKQWGADGYTLAIYTSALQADGQGEEASRLRQKKIDTGSNHGAFYNDEAKWLLEEKKDHKTAMAILEQARKQGCGDEYTIAIYALALQADGQGEEASQLRREKIYAGSSNATFYNDEAKWLLEEKKDPKAAMAALEQARKQRCENEHTLFIRTLALKQLSE